MKHLYTSLLLRCCLLGGLTLAGVAGRAIAAAPAGSAPVRVLIIDGFSNHDWKTTTERVKEILQRDGGFETAVSTSPGWTASPEAIAAWSPPLEHVDVVLMNCNDLGHPVHWSASVQRALEAFVAGGGGLYALHSANNSFEHWPEYNRMIGLGWRSKDFGPALEVDESAHVIRIPAGQGEKTSHGKRVDALVQRLGDDPIHRGLPAAWRAADTEVYTYVRGPAENVEVLTYSRDNKYNLGFPVEWVVHYGKGRVYSSSLGHLWQGDIDPPAFRCVAFQTILVRALRWLAGRAVETDVPPDFPTATAISLPPESPAAAATAAPHP